MTSDRAYVWIWLPGQATSVPCGAVVPDGSELVFFYARSYLARGEAFPLQPDGMPMRTGAQRPPLGLSEHGVLRDAAPDSWGMRVILRRIAGGDAHDTAELPMLTYLSEVGSNRIGALDVTRRPDVHEPRDAMASLEDLAGAAERVASGTPYVSELDEALALGSAVGGARPKVLLRGEGSRELIAKFSVSTDAFPWIQAEALGMELARRCGVNAVPTTLDRVGGRDVLLVDRFDRPGRGTRRHFVSALTLFGLDEMAARWGSYVALADLVRHRFVEPDATLSELFTRIAVNICVGNTDDHARNHAAFWDGDALELTPAYDVCPQPRAGGESSQAMAYGRDGQRAARLAGLVLAHRQYHLSRAEADEIVDRCTMVVRDEFDDACTSAGVDAATHDLLSGGAIDHPSIHYPAR